MRATRSWSGSVETRVVIESFVSSSWDSDGGRVSVGWRAIQSHRERRPIAAGPPDDDGEEAALLLTPAPLTAWQTVVTCVLRQLIWMRDAIQIKLSPKMTPKPVVNDTNHGNDPSSTSGSDISPAVYSVFFFFFFKF